MCICTLGFPSASLAFQTAGMGIRRAAPLREDSIFNAPGGIGGQPGPLGGVEAGDALDEADGSDGNQVLLIGALGVVFFGRVKQREESARLKAASHGPPNFRWMSRCSVSLVLPFLTTI